MTDIMKLAVGRRNQLMAEIEQRNAELEKINAFIRVGEGLLRATGEAGAEDAPAEAAPEMPSDGPLALEPLKPAAMNGGMSGS